MLAWLQRLRTADGAFAMLIDGEIDVRYADSRLGGVRSPPYPALTDARALDCRETTAT